MFFSYPLYLYVFSDITPPTEIFPTEAPSSYIYGIICAAVIGLVVMVICALDILSILFNKQEYIPKHVYSKKTQMRHARNVTEKKTK